MLFSVLRRKLLQYCMTVSLVMQIKLLVVVIVVVLYLSSVSSILVISSFTPPLIQPTRPFPMVVCLFTNK